MKTFPGRIKLAFILIVTLLSVAACSIQETPESIPADYLLSEDALIRKYLSGLEASAVVAANGQIAFSSDAIDDDGDGIFESNIYVMNPDGTGLRNITSTVPGSGQTEPAWSPDGSKIAFTNNNLTEMGVSNAHIWVINADGSNPNQLTTFEAEFNYAVNRQPDWSPDGTKIAYVTAYEGDYDIYIMNADGANQHNLFVGGEPFVSYPEYPDYPPVAGDEFEPSWSPDGTKLLYTAGRYTGTEIATVVVENASAETEVLLTTSILGDFSEPAWSPDGQLIAYTLYDYGPTLYVMNANGSNKTPIAAENVLNLFEPNFSPDGTLLTFIAYPAEVGSSPDLYAIPAPVAPLLAPAAIQTAAVTTAQRLTTTGGVSSADWQRKTVTTVTLHVKNQSLGGGKGTITSQPAGIKCGTKCKTEVAPGTKVTLTAKAKSGSKFLMWAGACKGRATTCTVTIDKVRLAIGLFGK